MQKANRILSLIISVLFAVSLFALFSPLPVVAAGVTIIAHGYNSDANGWVTAIADEITNYYRFPGTNSTIYTITLTTDGSNYYYQWQRANGSPPSATDSYEIIVKLDWSQMAGGLSAPYDISTYDVAGVARYVLLQTNSITDLSGHALAEYPIHLIGHSRGGSLMNELSRQLGTNGVWIDHLTTLDPHPLNNDGNFDLGFPTDASASNTYANVLFRDNYWQNFPGGLLDFNGESVFGAYDRYLDDQETSGGYANVASASVRHSNVHLWYHGTIDWRNPADDGAASITTYERTNWWASYEDYGGRAGLYYSLIGGGDRLSTIEPVGQGFGMVRDGYNQQWDFGAGQSNNRTSLPANNGIWPNIIKFNLTGTNLVAQGRTSSVTLYYQWGRPATSNAILSVYIDDDFNPHNGNERVLLEGSTPGLGTNQVRAGTVNINIDATNSRPGYHVLFAKISDGSYTRYLYAPEILTVFSSFDPPRLAILGGAGVQPRVDVTGIPGQRVVLQCSIDFQNWQPLATNWLATNVWRYSDSQPMVVRKFYRAMLQ